MNITKKVRKFVGLSLIGIALWACVRADEPTPFPSAPTQENADNRVPKLLKRVEAVYPAELLAQGLEDRVYVAFLVDREGNTKKVRSFFGRYPEFEAAAENAVRQWKFSPGMHEGKLVFTQMTVAIVFAPPAKQG